MTILDGGVLLDGGAVIAGRYRLREAIGIGSTGTVWGGHDLVSGAPIAVKVLHPGLFASPAARQRFGREASAAQSLLHPNLMRIESDGVTDDGRPYLVMERLQGQTLTTLLRTCGALPPARAIRIVAQILDALAAAHRAGLVHRDLKPDNVMVTDPGPDAAQTDLVKVCDFGLAKRVHDGDGQMHVDSGTATWPGEICGTPEYMAPEQARGEPLDARADLYAVAVILFQATTGALPFRGRSPLEVVSQQSTAPTPRPSALRPELRRWPALENLILRALSKDRRERPSSAEVFRADLLQVERDHEFGIDKQTGPAAVHQVETLRSAHRLHRLTGGWRARRRAPLIMVAAAALTLLAVVVRGRSSRRAVAAHSTATAEPVRAAPVRAEPARTVAVPATPPAGAPIDTPTQPQRHARRAHKPAAAPPVTGEAAAPTRPILEEAEDLLAAGDTARACEMGERAVQQAPELARARAFLGRCYMRLGRTTDARAHYARYLALTPNAPDAPFIRAIVGKDQP